MDSYLITTALGPVQSLIEAARRTRDLWCGSWLLSEAARAAALALHQARPGCLIFPCPDDPVAELKPQDEPREDSANIANILRAQVEAADPREIQGLCDAAKAAAAGRLAALCAQAKAKVPGLPLHEDLWQAQVDDILESFSAWTRIEGSDYRAASQRLGGLLAARKATRDFVPAATSPADPLGYSIPKSSLDAARESVIKVPKADRDGSRYRTQLRKLGLNRGEQLDALAFAKRLAGKAEQFTAYSRVAADPWIDLLTPEHQRRLCDVYEPLVGCGLATRARGNGPAYQAFPYDGQFLYDFRLANALTTRGLDENDKGALLALQRAVNGLAHQKGHRGDLLGTPVPYAAILKADGDRMGKLLGHAKTAAASRRISKDLHGFASAVRGIVQGHRGHAIYSGGDDVLALVPLDGAVGCADSLRSAFAQAMAGSAQDLGLPERDWPTLSVGLGLGHVMEPLGSLRARADLAEKRAKGSDLAPERQRNALAIVLGIRSGADHPWRAQWDDLDAFAALDRFRRAYRDGELPSRVAYDLRDIGRRLAWLGDHVKQGRTDAETAAGMRRSEVKRVLERARREGGTRDIAKDLQALILTRADTQPLDDLANTLIVARWISARTASEVGDRS